MKEETPNQTLPEIPAKKNNAKMVWMIVAIIAVVALLGSVAYGYISMKNLNKKISDQQSQIDDLTNTKKTLEDAASAASSAAANATTKATGNAITVQNDNDMITAAIKASCSVKNSEVPAAGPDIKTVTIKSVSGNYAQASYICAGGNEGPEAILVKSSGNWNIVAQGIGEFVPAKVRQMYSIPSSLPKY